METPGKEKVSITLHADLLAALRQLSRQSGRNLSNLIGYLLQESYERQLQPEAWLTDLIKTYKNLKSPLTVKEVWQDRTSKRSEHIPRRGDVWRICFNRTEHNQKIPRDFYCLILQNDVGNEHAETTIGALIGGRELATLPIHVRIPDAYWKKLGLDSDIILMEQICIIKKQWLVQKIGRIPDELWPEIEEALLFSLGFGIDNFTAPLRYNEHERSK